MRVRIRGYIIRNAKYRVNMAYLFHYCFNVEWIRVIKLTKQLYAMSNCTLRLVEPRFFKFNIYRSANSARRGKRRATIPC